MNIETQNAKVQKAFVNFMTALGESMVGVAQTTIREELAKAKVSAPARGAKTARVDKIRKRAKATAKPAKAKPVKVKRTRMSRADRAEAIAVAKEQVIAFIAENPNVLASEINAKFKSPVLTKALEQLRRDGQVVTSGATRWTTYNLPGKKAPAPNGTHEAKTEDKATPSRAVPKLVPDAEEVAGEAENVATDDESIEDDDEDDNDIEDDDVDPGEEDDDLD